MAPGHHWTTLLECAYREPRNGEVCLYVGTRMEIWLDIPGQSWHYRVPWHYHGTALNPKS